MSFLTTFNFHQHVPKHKKQNKDTQISITLTQILMSYIKLTHNLSNFHFVQNSEINTTNILHHVLNLKWSESTPTFKNPFDLGKNLLQEL